MSWSAEREAKLKVLWLQGMSGAQIAKELNKLEGPPLTRNAVIGKRIRLGLSDRSASPTRTRPRRKPRAAKPTQVVSMPKPVAHIDRAGRKRPPTLAERPNAKPWLQTRALRDCQFFLYGESGDCGFVCAEPVAPGKSWCAECLKLAFDQSVKARVA